MYKIFYIVEYKTIIFHNKRKYWILLLDERVDFESCVHRPVPIKINAFVFVSIKIKIMNGSLPDLVNLAIYPCAVSRPTLHFGSLQRSGIILYTRACITTYTIIIIIVVLISCTE